MPTVPTYETPQVEARALPGVRESSVASPALFGAAAEDQIAFGKGLMQAGSGLGQVAAHMIERDNLEKVQAADALYKEKLLDWKMQAHTKYQGVNAGAMLDDFKDWHEKQTAEIAKAFDNDAQRLTFGNIARKNYGLARSDFGGFVLKETDKTQAAALDATVSNEVNLASIAGSDAEVQSRKSNIVANIKAYGAAKGWDEALTQQKLGQSLTNLHMQRLQNTVDHDYEGAKAYYEANKGEIDGAERDKAEKVLKAGGIKTLAQKYADEIEASGLTEANAITAARQKFSGEEEAAAVGEIKMRFHEQRTAREGKQKDAADTAWSIFGRTNSMRSIPSAVVAEMDGRDLATMRKMAEHAAEGKKAKTDPGTYYDLRTLASQQPEDFKNLDLRRYFDKLDEGDREKFINLQQDVRKGDKPPATWEQQKMQIHNSLGWKAGDAEKKGAFDRVADQEFQQAKKRLGRDPNYQETQQIIDRLVIDGEVLSGHWYQNDPNKKFYEVRGTEDEAKFAPKVPDAERAKIEAALKRAGKPVTDAEVLRLFKAKSGLR